MSSDGTVSCAAENVRPSFAGVPSTSKNGAVTYGARHLLDVASRGGHGHEIICGAPAIAASVRLSCWISRKSPAEWLLCGSSADVDQTRTIFPSSRKGSGRSRTALTTLKMAVLAAMPSAIVTRAMEVNAGVLSSVLMA